MFTTRSAATVAEPSTAPARSGEPSTEVSAYPDSPGSRATLERPQADFDKATKARKPLDGAEIDNSIERRESRPPDARIAAFEATARRFANDEFIQRDQLRREQEERAKKLNETPQERANKRSRKKTLSSRRGSRSLLNLQGL